MALAVLAAGSLTVQADMLASEYFDYDDGALADQNGGTGFATAWGDANGNSGSGTHTVASGVAFNDGTIFRGLSTAFAEGTYWLQFDFQGNNSYSGIQFFAGTDEKLLIGGRGSGVWAMSGDNLNTVYSEVSYSSMLTGVVKLDVGSTTTDISVWIDADGNGVVNTDDTADLASAGDLDSLVGVDTIRLGNGGNGQLFDNLEIAESSADLTTTVIPEPATLGLAGMAGLGVLVIRRRFMM